MGITEQSPLTRAELEVYAEITMDVVVHGRGKEELFRRLMEIRGQVERERDQARKRDVETLLGALGIRNDDLGTPGSENYLNARKYAQTIVSVIRNNGPDKELNDASKAILELAPKRSFLRSLVNPRKDTIDWYDAAWRNEEEMSKLDTTKWGGYIRNKIYQFNQPFAGPTNTRSGNLAFIGLQALAGTAYTSYIEKSFAISTFVSSFEYAAAARILYKLTPNPFNQGGDTIQFQAVSIGLYEGFKHLISNGHNATMSS